MKKLFLALAVVAFSTMAAQAQDNNMAAKKTTLSIGVNVGAPTSSPSVYSIAYGVDLQADFAVAPTTSITASAGYENYSVKSKYGSGSNGFVPLLVGAKFYFGDMHKMYGHAQVGYAFSTQSGGGGSFAYAPSIGYYFSPKFDASLKYLAFSNSSVFEKFPLNVVPAGG